MVKERGFTPLEITSKLTSYFNHAKSKRRFYSNDGGVLRPPKRCGGLSLTGFTLFELLIVITIISVLISILLPALRTARAKAHQVACMSNLKQLHMAYELYAMENRDYYPKECDSDYSDKWYQRLQPYYGNSKILACPVANPKLTCTYGPPHTSMGSCADGDFHRSSEFTHPSETAMLIDTYKWSSNPFQLGTGSENDVRWRHSSGANVLFVDGHVKWRATLPSDVDDPVWRR